MKNIPLTQSKVAVVDDSDYNGLINFKWFANYQHGIWYAIRSESINGIEKKISMHRQIMGFPEAMEVDHKNHDGLDNRRCNLRTCNHSQNTKNSFIQKNSTSGLNGVSFNKRNGKWIAHIKKEQKRIHLGFFDNKEDAGRAVDKKAKELFGEYAILNFKE